MVQNQVGPTKKSLFFLLPVVVLAVLSVGRYAFWSLNTPLLMNDWRWITSISSLDGFLSTTMTFESFRVFSRLLLFLDFELFGPQSWVANFINLVIDFGGAVIGYRIFRAVGATKLSAAVGTLFAFFHRANLNHFAFRASSEASVGRTAVLTVVYWGLREKSSALVGCMLVIVAGLFHETIMLAFPLILLIRVSLYGIKRTKEWLFASALGPAAFAVGVTIFLLIRRFFWVHANTHELNPSRITDNLWMVGQGVGMAAEIAGVFAVVISRWGNATQVFRSLQIGFGWMVLGIIPYIAMPYWSDYFLNLAIWGIGLLLGESIGAATTLGYRCWTKRSKLREKVGVASKWSKGLYLLIAGTPCAKLSMGSVITMSDNPDFRHFSESAIRAAQRAIEQDPEAKERLFVVVHEGPGQPPEYLNVQALLCIEASNTQSEMLTALHPNTVFEVQVVSTPSTNKIVYQRRDALMHIRCSETTACEITP